MELYIYIPRAPSTFSEGDWRHSYVGFEGPSTFREGTWIPIYIYIQGLCQVTTYDS